MVDCFENAHLETAAVDRQLACTAKLDTKRPTQRKTRSTNGRLSGAPAGGEQSAGRMPRSLLCGCGRGGALLRQLVVRRHRKQSRVGFGEADVGDGENLRSLGWVHALHHQVHAEFWRVPELLGEHDLAVVADGARIGSSRLARADGLKSFELTLAHVFAAEIAMAVAEWAYRNGGFVYQ